jgi:MSHA biogenesis protein MshI
MLDWLKGGGRTPGWLAVSFDDASLRFAHARREAGVRALVSAYGERELGAGKGTLERLAREFKLSHYQCSSLLSAGEYDLLLVEAPKVPRAELKSALRWKVKDMVDYKIDEATLDVLEIPSDAADAAASSGPHVLAVLARNELLRSRVQQFERARIPLSVIEIPETAQRNIAALYEEEGRAALLLYFGKDWGLLTITLGGELHLVRRLDIGVEQAQAVALEVQRTLDHFERQFAHVTVGKLLLAPTGRRTDLPETLRSRFEMPVQEIDLRDVLAFGDAPPDEQTQWRLFHHFGAALRDAT